MTAPHEPLGRACRHFVAREALIGDGQCCKIGHPIRETTAAYARGYNDAIRAITDAMQLWIEECQYD